MYGPLDRRIVERWTEVFSFETSRKKKSNGIVKKNENIGVEPKILIIFLNFSLLVKLANSTPWIHHFLSEAATESVL